MIKLGTRVYDNRVGMHDSGILVGISENKAIVYWDGLKESYRHPSHFSSGEIDKSVLPINFITNLFATLSFSRISVLTKKVKNTALSRKMYPDHEVEGDYIVVEV